MGEQFPKFQIIDIALLTFQVEWKFFLQQRILKIFFCNSFFFSSYFGKSKVKGTPCSGNPSSYFRGDEIFKKYQKSGGGNIFYRNGEGCPKESCDFLTVLT